MTGPKRPQTWQVVNQNALDVLETATREPLSNLNKILDTKIDYPFRLSLSGTKVTVNISELQTLKSDGALGTINSFKVATSPIQGQYLSFSISELNLDTGIITGDFPASPFCPNVTANYYIRLGLEAKSDGKINLNWGNESATILGATYPTFSSGTAVALLLLQKNGTTGIWNFLAPDPEDIIIFKGSGGGGGGGTDLVPIYKTSNEYRIQGTQGRRVRFNEKFFYANTDIDFNFDLSVDRTKYICFNTNKPQGLIDSTYIEESILDPTDISFPQHLAVLGYYVVSGGTVTQTSLVAYSTREHDNFIGDLTPTYNSTSQYRIQSTRNKKIKLNGKYYYSTDDILNNFTTSSDGTWYICVDTNQAEGILTSLHFENTNLDPKEIGFKQNLIPVGEYTVSGGAVAQNALSPYAIPEKDNTFGGIVPSYFDSTSYALQSSDKRKIKLLDNYYYLSSNLVNSFTTSSSGTWYICIDTNQPAGEITSGHLVNTQNAPTSSTFDPDYVAIAEYEVTPSLTVPLSGFIPYYLSGLAKSQKEHFVPIYVNQTQFSLKSTDGRSVFLNNKYYKISSEIFKNFDVSANGTWYICIDTFLASGTINSSYIVLTQVDPFTNIFNHHYVVIGKYNVVGGVVDSTSFDPYSSREMVRWVYSIPDIFRSSEQKLAPGTYAFAHNLNVVPHTVTYKYWKQADSKFYNIDRFEVETSLNATAINYIIPAGDSLMTFAVGDYFEVEAYVYEYNGARGFASPKTDFSSDWFTSTPTNTISHNLFTNPKNITLEFYDNGVYYVEDGNQYIDKNSGGITNTSVTFNWVGLPTLSASVQMRVHMQVSKLSAGSFAASKTESGTVLVTGNQSLTVSPDVILTATDTNFATKVNSAGNNIRVLVTENITITSTQAITVSGVIWDMLPGKTISTASAVADMVVFSGEDFEINTIRLESKATNTTALKLSASGIVNNLLVKQNAAATTLTNAVEVTTGNIATVIGRAKAVAGNLTNKFSDIDFNSEIVIS